jgi:hypothetical protein
MNQELFDRLFEQHAAGTLDENDMGRLLAMLRKHWTGICMPCTSQTRTWKMPAC